MSYEVDFSNFNAKLPQIVDKAIPSEAGNGLFKAANQLLDDAMYKRPFAPFKMGDLRGSARVDKAVVVGSLISVMCGFNIEYAARWHELTPAEDARINWTLPGSGAKYLESKMARYMADYMEIVASHIRNSA